LSGWGSAAAIGGVLGWQTRRHVMWSAMRQVFVVSLAAGLTFLVGWLLETATS
jgi:VIT1/CCC1 family predicted Fe2+/Mn2+ transporter